MPHDAIAKYIFHITLGRVLCNMSDIFALSCDNSSHSPKYKFHITLICALGVLGGILTRVTLPICQSSVPCVILALLRLHASVHSISLVGAKTQPIVLVSAPMEQNREENVLLVLEYICRIQDLFYFTQ